MSDRPAVGVVGAGRAGTALALALVRAGWPVAALSSRDPDRRAALRAGFPDALVTAAPREVAAAADLVLLAVPDDVIGEVAADLGARPGSVVAHLSGVHPAEVLRAALAPEVAAGAFHPLVAFPDVSEAAEALRGSFAAIDGDPRAVAALTAMAETLGVRVVVVRGTPATTDLCVVKAAHHAAAVLAAGGFVALLDAIAELGRVVGMTQATAVEVYGSLVRQGLANAGALTTGGALTGPVVRGDVGTVRRHLDALASVAPDVRELYLATARRQLAMARARDMLDPARADAIASVLEGTPVVALGEPGSNDTQTDHPDRVPGPPR